MQFDMPIAVRFQLYPLFIAFQTACEYIWQQIMRFLTTFISYDYRKFHKMYFKKIYKPTEKIDP